MLEVIRIVKLRQVYYVPTKLAASEFIHFMQDGFVITLVVLFVIFWLELWFLEEIFFG